MLHSYCGTPLNEFPMFSHLTGTRLNGTKLNPLHKPDVHLSLIETSAIFHFLDCASASRDGFPLPLHCGAIRLREILIQPARSLKLCLF